MTMMKPRSMFAGTVILGLLFAACQNLQEPATKAVTDATATLQALSTDAQKYAPEQYSQVSAQVADMKAALDKKDYQGVINMAPKAAASMKALREVAAAKKNEAMEALSSEWASLSNSMPSAVGAVESKLAEFKKTKKLPAGVTKDAFAAAPAALDDAKKAWADAQSASGAGNVEDAVAKAKDAQAKISAIMASIGMGSGDTAAK